MNIKKLRSFLRLKGINKEGNKLIQKEKRKYFFARLSKHTHIKKGYSLGQTMEKPVIANSCGLFHCRPNCIDLHIISDSYEFDVKEIYEKLAKESKVIVDVGSNIGRYTILGGFANPNSKIYSIEPESDNYKILLTNIALNKLHNIIPMHIALGKEKETSKLYKSDERKNYGGHSFAYIVNPSDFEVVNVNSFDNLFKDEEEQIDLIKIDVEGFELEVLKGMQLFLSEHRIKNMLLEIDENKYQEVVSLLENYGYSVEKIMYNNYLVKLNRKGGNN